MSTSGAVAYLALNARLRNGKGNRAQRNEDANCGRKLSHGAMCDCSFFETYSVEVGCLAREQKTYKMVRQSRRRVVGMMSPSSGLLIKCKSTLGHTGTSHHTFGSLQQCERSCREVWSSTNDGRIIFPAVVISSKTAGTYPKLITSTPNNVHGTAACWLLDTSKTSKIRYKSIFACYPSHTLPQPS